MPKNLQRITLRKTAANAWYIRDNSDESIVCMVHRGRRDPEKTQAMIKVMLRALNDACQQTPRGMERGQA